MMNKQHPILIVEDSPEDYEATLRAFQKANLANPIIHCEDGDEALDYIFQKGKYADKEKYQRPGLILLDLNLPGTDGREFLEEIKKESELKKIPVVVLTTSSSQEDIDRCYAAGANSYVCKPVSVIDLVDAIQRLKDFWFEIVVYPKGE